MPTVNPSFAYVKYPDAIAPIFNQQFIEVGVGDKYVNNGKCDITFTFSWASSSFVDVRQPAPKKTGSNYSICKMDCASYLRAFFYDITDNPEQRQKEINVKITAEDYTTGSMVTLLDTMLYAIRAYSTPLAPLGAGLTQVYYRGLHQRYEQVFTLLSGDQDPVETMRGTDLGVWIGLQDFICGELWQSDEADDIYTYFLGNKKVVTHFITTDETEGVLLKWLDAQGFFRHYLFCEGERTLTTKDSGEDITLSYTGKQPLAFTDDSYMSTINIPQGVEVKMTQKLCAVLVREELRPLLDTIYSAPFVWVVDLENNIDIPVTVKRGSVDSKRGVQDYEIEINYPTPPIMSL